MIRQSDIDPPTEREQLVTVDSVEMGEEVVSAEVRSPEVSFSLSFRVRNGRFGRELDFLLPLTLLPAMRAGVSLSLPGPVSPRLLAGVRKVQGIFRLWNDSYSGVAVDVGPGRGDVQPASGVGCFLSGGVDSFYSTIEHLPEITHLIFLEGAFDRPSAVARENVRAAAAELGKPLVEVETNLRSFSNAFGVDFADFGGPALAAVALLFQHQFRKVLIASSYSYAALARYGSHPLVDPLWSTEALEIVHDGCEATRPMKVARLAQNDVAMRRLRVCQQGATDPKRLNCGRCPKCLGTRVNLRAVSALGSCTTLPDDLDLREVGELSLGDDGDLAFLTETARAVEEEGHDEELGAMLRSRLEKHYRDGGPTIPVELHDPFFLRRRLSNAERVCRKREREIHQLTNSLSWRITAPLRSVARTIHPRRPRP